jgi:glycerate kinase
MAGMPAPSDAQPRVLAAPDKLKGTLGAREAAAAMVAGAADVGLAARACPLSDGGEGFADALAHLGGEERITTVTGPLGAPVAARWRLAGDLAVLESAAASGLVLAGGAEGNDPVAATSRGTGELVVAALAAGARRILLGVGGSAMTDGGSAARAVVLGAGGLGDAELVVACDVRITFVEAAERFGPQKGATPSQVAALRRRLESLAGEYAAVGSDVVGLPGSGAAGGLAGGLAAVGARLVPGFDLVADMVGLDDMVAISVLVLGAEGRLDAGSWDGKVVDGLADRCRRQGVPLVVVAGTADAEGRAGAERRGVEVLDLAEHVGEARAMAEPAASIRQVVGARLASLAGR